MREWAVLQSYQDGQRVIKGRLNTREEAEAYLPALEITLKVEADRFRQHDMAILDTGPLFVGYRDITAWVPAESG